MKKLIKLFLYINILIFVSSNIFAQSAELKFSHLSVEQGLSQSAVNCIIQDSKGFLWFGTQDGLNRYDGYDFKLFGANLADSNSLSSNYINSIIEDKENNLWIGTKNGGLNRFNLATGKITQFFQIPNKQNWIPENNIYSVLEDKNGDIWFTTSSYLCKYEKEKDIFISYAYGNTENSTSKYDKFPIIEDYIGNIWVGTPEGIKIFNPQKQFFKDFRRDYNLLQNNIDIEKGEHIYSLLEDKLGRIWIGSSNGLFLYNLIKRTVEKIELKSNNSINNFPVSFVYEYISGDILVGTIGSGLFVYNPKNNTSKQYTVNNLYNYSISNNVIISIFKDKSGIFWIGTWGNGLNKIDEFEHKFEKYIPIPDPNQKTSDNNVGSIYTEGGDTIWVGTWGNGLILHNRKNKKYKIYTYDPKNKFSILGNEVYSIIKLDKNNLLIGTNKGLCTFNIKTELFNIFKIQNNNSWNKEFTTCSFKDSQNNLWIGTEEGVIIIDKNNNARQISNKVGSEPLLTSNSIMCINEDHRGNIWIGTFDGLNEYSKETGKITKYTYSIYEKNTLSNNIVLSICPDNKNGIWIGTFSGLNYLNFSNYRFKSYRANGEVGGLINDVIYGILPDKNNRLWLSTNKGICGFNYNNQTYSSYDIYDGLQSYEFNKGSYFKSNTGELFFGGINGFNSFYPDSISNNKFIPPIALTNFYLFNKQSKLDSNIAYKKHLILSYTDVFSFEFSALNYSRPEKNEYAYMLEGESNEWNFSSNRRYVTYDKLLPGDYIFRVKATNNDSQWNELGTKIKITITPPFYAKPWFLIIVILSIVALIRAIFLYRTRALRKKNKILLEKQLIAEQVAEQKEELSRKNKDITDSLNYAKRIQDGIMTTEIDFIKFFPDSFILFKPKEIVSGDFFWMHIKENLIYFAVVDCTGHGVPGAIMSIMAHNLLTQALKDLKNPKPSEILEEVNKGVNRTFHREDDNIKDGMDMALCCYNSQNQILSFAGAYNPIIHISGDEFNIIKGDRYPIGLFDFDEIEGFTNNEISIKPSDKIYIFSDGYADQFGGPDGKKFQSKRLKKLLEQIQEYPMQKQKNVLLETLDTWMGNLEQVDDILFVGIKFK